MRLWVVSGVLEGRGRGFVLCGGFFFPLFNLDVWGNIDFGGFSFLREFFLFFFLSFEKEEGD